MTALQIPQHVALNETVRMMCNFNLDQETLYSVKWYKDGHEFYRYEPNEMPDVQVYPLEGVTVDVCCILYNLFVCTLYKYHIISLSSFYYFRCCTLPDEIFG